MELVTANPHSSDDVLDHLIRWASGLDAIRVVLLTSTRAIPGASVDALSDYDVILVVGDIRPFVVDHAWLDEFGHVLVAYWDPVHPDPLYGIDHCANVVQYISGLKIDFTLWPVELFQQVAVAPTLLAELDAGYRVLLDKDHLSDHLASPTGKAYIPAKPTPDAYQQLVNDFLSDAPYVAKCLYRHELLPAKWCLECDMRHLYLRQLLEWRVELDHAWSLPMGSLGKGLNKHLPAGLWSEFEATFAGAKIEDNWAALFATLDFFRRVAIQVGGSLGYVYPEELHQRVRVYVEHIRQNRQILLANVHSAQ